MSETTGATPRKPNFFLVGGAKCGTTSMFRYLAQHPDVFIPDVKEPHHFSHDIASVDHVNDPDAYAALFADAGDAPIVGDASTSYLPSEVAAREIKRFTPDARILIMLRNPVDTMHSRHSQALVNGEEEIRDFEAALDAEADRAEGRRIPAVCRCPPTLQYRKNVRFARQVERYFEAFGRDRVHVAFLDDLKADPEGTFADVLRFLDVDATFRPPTFDVVNPNEHVKSAALTRFLRTPPQPVARLARALVPGDVRERLVARAHLANRRVGERPPMSRALRRRLQDEMREDVEALARLTGRDLSHWLKETRDPASSVAGRAHDARPA